MSTSFALRSRFIAASRQTIQQNSISPNASSLGSKSTAQTNLCARNTSLPVTTAFSHIHSWSTVGSHNNLLNQSLQCQLPPQQNQVRFRSNRSRRGIYDGKDIRTGNNVSFSNRKTKRKFKPNVFKKRVYSETLDEMIQFHVTASTLRSIDKVGGLDNYLLTTKHIGEGEGVETKKRILKAKKVEAMMEEQESM